MRLSDLQPGDKFIRKLEGSGQVEGELWTLTNVGREMSYVARSHFGLNTFRENIEVIKIVDKIVD